MPLWRSFANPYRLPYGVTDLLAPQKQHVTGHQPEGKRSLRVTGFSA
jgi:hypothetical protein